MRRDHHTSPYDVEIDRIDDPNADLTEQFWGDTRGWTSREQPVVGQRPPAERPSDATGSIRVIKDGFAAFRPRVIDRDLSGGFARTRQHGVVRGAESEQPTVMLHGERAARDADVREADVREADVREATIGELGSGFDSITPSMAASMAASINRSAAPSIDAPVASRRQVSVATDPMVADVGEQLSGDLPGSLSGDVMFDDDGFGAVVPPAGHRGRRGGRAGRDSIDHYELDPVPNGLADRLGVGAVDPLIARIGIVVAVLSLLVPLALALRPSDASATVDGEAIESPDAVIMASEIVTTPAGGDAPLAEAVTGNTTSGDTTSGDTASAAPDTAAADSSSTVGGVTNDAATTVDSAVATASSSSGSSGSSDSTDVGATAQREPGAIAGAASAATDADRTIPACPLQYTAGPGDSWYGIADRAGIAPNDLLIENRATVDTVILPGDEICLPAGATVPATPTTVPATTVPAPTTTAPTTTPTTTAPVTTAPTTTTPAVTVPPSAAEIERIIREIWPDDQEETALLVVQRESGFDPNAHNGHCCYGLFQIYYSVHQSWLTQFGIHQASDLYDVRKNVTAAYALYQDAGGWSPWSQTAY